MTDSPKTASTAPEYLDDYVGAAGHVVKIIGARDDTHGDPEAFGSTFAAMLEAYMRPALASGRRLGPADGFVVLDLMKSARIAVGGVHPDHFADKAGYGLLGLVHAARAFATLQAHQDAQNAPAPAAAPEPERDAELWGDEPEGPPAAPAPGPDTRAARKPAPVPEPEPVELAATDQDDDDADLVRWALSPAHTPFADLLEPMDGDYARLRPGVTVEAVEARRLRLVELLRALPMSDARTEALDRYSEAFPMLAAKAA